jgi:hypothetical protein
MYKIFINATEEQYEELYGHLKMNGYTCYNAWLTDNCLEVDEEEIYEVETILNDRNIEYRVVEY